MNQSAARTSVLLVEDEIMISDVVADAMNAHGFNVHAVADEESALRYLESGKPVDVLFSDGNLPGRMNGEQLATQARAMRPDMPIVYTSGRYSQSAIEPPVSRSIFVAKPHDLAELCMLLNRIEPAH